MSLVSWLSLVLICCLGAMTPGPSLAVVLKQTTDNGQLHALTASWCHAIGVGFWAFACIFGLALVVAQSPALFQLITWAGALYLGYIGYKALRASKNSAPPTAPNSKSVSLFSSGMQGAMISVLNPKLAIFFIAIFSQFISDDASILDQAIMIATVILIDGLWYSVVVLLLAKGPVLKWLREKNQWVNRITGAVFLLLAIRVVTF
jgi:threonine/homoserine/homoserine lactone efflux protein